MPDKTEDIEIRLLFEALLSKYHYDFRNYSMASIKRRVLLAKDRLNCHSISALQDRVLNDPDFLPYLMNYLTVQVSEMFRDPGYFRVLRERVIPYLKTYPSLKVWVAGCSTGEELYSLAILFREEGLETRTIFYATDINRQSLQKAEAGVYPLDQIPLFTANYQASGGVRSFSDYYTADYNAAIFDRRLRERVVFSDHSLVSDAVFSEVHLVSCRNVLIYFNRELQDRALSLFASSLLRHGFLGLGAKESLQFSTFGEAFDEFAPKERIYRKKEGL